MKNFALLRARIAGQGASKPSLSAPDSTYQWSSTALNAHRDKINELGVRKFASDIGSTLTHFYSQDKMAIKWDSGGWSGKKSRANLLDPLRSNSKIAIALQEKLVGTSTWKHWAPSWEIISCMGIASDDKTQWGTECCVTNGADATVVGWKAHYITHDKLALDVCFVRLTNPPTQCNWKVCLKN